MAKKINVTNQVAVAIYHKALCSNYAFDEKQRKQVSKEVNDTLNAETLVDAVNVLKGYNYQDPDICAKKIRAAGGVIDPKTYTICAYYEDNNQPFTACEEGVDAKAALEAFCAAYSGMRICAVIEGEHCNEIEGDVCIPC
jgi:hypothetical protein